MIGKIIGAVAGAKAAQQTPKIGGATGAALGVVAPAVLRRMSIPAMLAIGAGGYLVKRYLDKREQANDTEPTPPKVEPAAT